jgi:hypothetical protein
MVPIKADVLFVVALDVRMLIIVGNVQLLKKIEMVVQRLLI